MEFYLAALDDRIQFPVPPERITCQTGSRLQTFEVLDLGTIVWPLGTTPERLSFEGFFPGESRKDVPYVQNWRPPLELVEILSRWRDRGSQMRLLITDTPINLLVYFEEDGFQHEWRGGHGDCWYTLRFVRARHLIVHAEGQEQQAAIVQAEAQPAPPPPRTYTVKAGDTLYGIAKKTLGDGSRWKELYKNNKDVIGPDPDRILPGQVLRVK